MLEKIKRIRKHKWSFFAFEIFMSPSKTKLPQTLPQETNTEGVGYLVGRGRPLGEVGWKEPALPRGCGVGGF